MWLDFSYSRSHVLLSYFVCDILEGNLNCSGDNNEALIGDREFLSQMLHILKLSS